MEHVKKIVKAAPLGDGRLLVVGVLILDDSGTFQCVKIGTYAL